MIEADPALQAVGLGYRFPDGQWAFRGIDLELRSGDLCLLAGRNGSGKSFLAKHLAGLMYPTEGSIRVLGRPLSGIEGGPASWVGYVFQDAALQTVGETVFDDALFGPTCLGLPAKEAKSRAGEALAACALTSLAEAFVHSLSGGERRKLAIAGVLAMRPKVLILDEPFANLDPEGVGAIVRLIGKLKDSGIAILVVTHEIEKILGLASSFVIMEKGKFVLSGEPEAVLESGIEPYGLRNPLRARSRQGLRLEDLLWI